MGNLPDPYWLLYFLSIVLFIPPLLAINSLNQGNRAKQENSRLRPINVVAYITLLPILLFACLSAFCMIPSGEVVAGSRLPERQLEFLRNYYLLAPGETIDYFYSAGMFSFEQDGNYFTNYRVVSYWKEPDGSIYAAHARYADIEDIKVVYSKSFLEDTVVTIVTADEEFELWVSRTWRKDTRFVYELRQRWREADPP